MPLHRWRTYKIVFGFSIILLVSVMNGICGFLSWSATVAIFIVISVQAAQRFLRHKHALPTELILELLKKIHEPSETTRKLGKLQSGKSTLECKVETRTPDQSGNLGHHHENQVLVREVDTCLHFIMRDFVMSWYHSVSSNNQFSKEVYYMMEDLSVALASRIKKANKHKFVQKFLHLLHIYFREYLLSLKLVCKRNGHRKLRESIGRNIKVEKEFQNYHSAMQSSENESIHLQNVVNILLEVLTPVDALSCHLARKLLSEILAKNVMLPLMDLISDPDWLNQKIVSVLKDDPEVAEKVVHSLMSELQCSAPLIHSEDVTSSVFDTQDVQNRKIPDIIESTPTPVCESEVKFEDSLDVAQMDIPEEPLAEEVCAESYEDIEKSEASELPEENNSSGETKKPVPNLPVSRSFEHLSGFFNTLGDVKPIEYFTVNLAQYFKLASDGLDKVNSMQSLHPFREETDSVMSKSAHEFSDSLQTTSGITAKQILNKRRSSTSDLCDSMRSVSSALGGIITASAGLVLTDRLHGLDLKSTQQCSSPLSDNSGDIILNSQKHIGESYSPPCSQQPQLSPVPERRGSSTSSSRRNSLSLKLNLRSPFDSSAELNFPWSSQMTSTPIDVPDSVVEAVELSPVNRCFMNLRIPNTEIADEPNGSGQYVLYCIQYEAWYLDPSSFQTTDVGSYVDVAEPHMVLHGTQVKRRFREFMTLQTRLEENPQLKSHLHDVQRPSRWLGLPFSKTDKETIEERKIFLEKYLQKLISKEEISASVELREFLAYGGDASIAYVKKIPDSMVPRFDKFLAKKVSGMVEKIKAALPTLPTDSSPVDPSSMSIVPAPSTSKPSERRGFLGFQFGSQDERYPLCVQFGFAEKEAQSSEPVLEDLLRRFVNNSQYSEATESDNVKPTFPFKYSSQDSSFSPSQDIPMTPDIPTCTALMLADLETTSELRSLEDLHLSQCMAVLDQEIPLASAALNLLVDAIADEDAWVIKERFIFAVKIISGKLLESWMQDLVNKYTTQEMCIRYVRRARDAIWPGGLLPMDLEPSPTAEEMQANKEAAFQSLKGFFPGIFPRFIGEDLYEVSVRLLLDSFQQPKLLRHLMYNVLDLVVESLAPEMRSDPFQQRLLHSR